VNRVTQRVLFVIVITLLSWPFAIRMSEAQQNIAQQSMILQSTTQSGQMQVLVIGESVFTSSAQRAVAVTEEDIVIIDAQSIYRVTVQGTTVEPRAGSCACLPQRCCCSPVGTPCHWCPGLDPC
jgi:uncharacterized protein YeaC (DUF1315 family)